MKNILKISAVAFMELLFASCKKENVPGAKLRKISGQVDLELSVKWTNMNLGAIDEDDPGDFYAWGETGTKSFNRYCAKFYKFADPAGLMTKYSESPTLGVADGNAGPDSACTL